MAEAYQPKDYVSAQERLAEQDWSTTAKAGILAMAPAEKGWILGVVTVFCFFIASVTYAATTILTNWAEEEARSNIQMVQFLAKVMETQEAMTRRLQEQNALCMGTVSRALERRSRVEEQQQLIDKRGN